MQKYIEALTSKTKPKKILVCLIYYPDENNAPSWANAALGALGYNRNPAKIQLLLRKIFEEATRYVYHCRWSHYCIDTVTRLNSFHLLLYSTIKISGSEVIPIPLYIPLDGTRTEDYVARVEPSAIGGRKMAEYLLGAVLAKGTSAHLHPTSSAPSTSFIDGR